MSTIRQGEQPAPPGASFEQEGVESLKIERNSKGFNYSYRVVKREGDTWTAVIERAARINEGLEAEFGPAR